MCLSRHFWGRGGERLLREARGAHEEPHHNQALDQVTRASRTPEKEAPGARQAWGPGLAVGGLPLPRKSVPSQQVSGAGERGSPEGLRTCAPRHVSRRWGPGPQSTFCIWGSSPERQLRPQ